jgi:hypothetical protein
VDKTLLPCFFARDRHTSAIGFRRECVRVERVCSPFCCALFIEKFDALRFVPSKVNLVLDVARSPGTSRPNKKELDLALCAKLAGDFEYILSQHSAIFLIPLCGIYKTGRNFSPA